MLTLELESERVLHCRMEDVLCTQVRQVQCEGNYEKMVLRMHEWMEEEGYDAFAEVIEVSPKRYELRLLMDEKGTPHVPEVEAEKMSRPGFFF